MTTRVHFHFDPVCPWTWTTARWMTAVAERRNVLVRWRPFSLKLKNEGTEAPYEYQVRGQASHRALRVIEAVRRHDGEERVLPLYLAIGSQIHHHGDNPFTQISGALEVCGLDPARAEAADDESWDDAIRDAMTEALELAGPEAGSPVVVFPDWRVGFFGPIVSSAASEDGGLALWDGLAALARVPGFYELKRARNAGPQLPTRPRFPSLTRS